jgi:hypothetical protein
MALAELAASVSRVVDQVMTWGAVARSACHHPETVRLGGGGADDCPSLRECTVCGSLDV